MRKLKSCDILLFRIKSTSSFSQKFIAWAERLIYKAPPKAEYCHVALVDSDTTLMFEAVWPKTRVSKIDFEEISKKEIVEVYSVPGLTDEQKEQVLTWMRDHLDEWYDVALFLTGWLDMKHAEVCSTYVSNGFRAAGLEVPQGAWSRKIVIPDDFYIDNAELGLVHYEGIMACSKCNRKRYREKLVKKGKRTFLVKACLTCSTEYGLIEVRKSKLTNEWVEKDSDREDK